MISPRYIDLHTHGLGGRDTRTDDPADILTLAELHGAAGTVAILPTIYPGPIGQMRKQMEAVRRAMQTQKTGGSSQGGAAARILGLHLEGPFLNPARCGALDPSSFVRPSAKALGLLVQDYEEIIKIITIAPELPGALQVIRQCAEMKIRVNMGHSDATYDDALRGKEAGASGITHIFNAMRPFHHRNPGLAVMGLVDDDLYIEVIADGIHLHPRTLALVFSVKRLDRIVLVSDSVRGTRRGKPLYTGNKTLAGSGITLADSLTVLQDLGIPDAEIEEAAFDNPKRYLGMRSDRSPASNRDAHAAPQ